MSSRERRMMIRDFLQRSMPPVMAAAFAIGGCGTDPGANGFRTTEPNPQQISDMSESALADDQQHDVELSDSSHASNSSRSPSCWELGPEDDCASYGCETLLADHEDSVQSCFERSPVGCLPAESNCSNTNEFVWWNQECWRISSTCLPEGWKLSTGTRRDECQDKFERFPKCE